MRRLPLRSPPRVRGKATRSQMPMRPPGITPAYAGKRSSCRPSACRFRDHPRVCGEKQSWASNPSPGKGPPPRMRGKARCSCRRWKKSRITPAYAGKSSSASSFAPSSGDHPRVCGEKATHRGSLRSKEGSPPRVRGKASHHEVCVLVLGITPAYAGKSLRIPRCATRWREHPRACGEKYFSLQVRRSVLYSF